MHPLRNPCHDKFSDVLIKWPTILRYRQCCTADEQKRASSVRFKKKLCEIKLDWDENLIGELLTEWEGLTSDLQQFPPIKIPICSVQTSECNSMTTTNSICRRCLLAVSVLQDQSGPPQEGHYTSTWTPVRSAISEANLHGTTCAEARDTDNVCNLPYQFTSGTLLDYRRQGVEATEWQRYARTRHPTAGSTAQEFRIKLTFPPGVYPKGSWDCGPHIEFVAVSNRIRRNNDNAGAVPRGNLDTRRGETNDDTFEFQYPVCHPPIWIISGNGLCLQVREHWRITIFKNQYIWSSHSHQTKSICWLKVSQSPIPEMDKFSSLSLWRNGRLQNSDAPFSYTSNSTQQGAPPTVLIVIECHKKFMHSGVKATLTELRSKYWIVQARNFIRFLTRESILPDLSTFWIQSTPLQGKYGCVYFDVVSFAASDASLREPP